LSKPNLKKISERLWFFYKNICIYEKFVIPLQ
jgi:hypothetical protein